MLFTESSLALSPLCGDLNPEVLLMPFLPICELRKLNLLCTQCCLSVTSFESWLDLDCVSFPYLSIPYLPITQLNVTNSRASLNDYFDSKVPNLIALGFPLAFPVPW